MMPYAIFFAASDDYSFALANVIMGLKRYSPDLMNRCNIIVYHDDLCERNRKLLASLHEHIIFEEMIFPLSWQKILSDEVTQQWGNYVIAKLFGFRLIEKYEKALFLDVDMLIRGDISDLFSLTEEMAWRNVLGWSLPFDGRLVPGGNGGLILFSSELLKYHITDQDIADLYGKVKDIHRGGTDERILTALAVRNGIKVHILDRDLYNTPTYYVTQETKILHFLDYKGICTKPWKNPAAYVYFTDWAENYREWLNMGGKGLVDFSREDWFGLFGFDKQLQMEALKNEEQRLRNQLSVALREQSRMEQSEFWKITYPLRWIVKKIKGCLPRR